MAYGCGNCGGLFTDHEAAHMKPPMHPWPMTAQGQRTIHQIPARGVLGICPSCGQPTMYARAKS